MDLKLIVDLANILVALGVIFAITQININRKTLHFSTIQRCIDEFRNILDKGDYTEKDIIRYVDLVNEELFYFQHNYLPKVIALEWLDGMLDYVPIADNKGNVVNPNHCLLLFGKNRDRYLLNYPRLKQTFLVRQDFDTSIIYSNDAFKQELRALKRKAIVEELYNNVINFSF